jgi:hypothetical protein
MNRTWHLSEIGHPDSQICSTGIFTYMTVGAYQLGTLKLNTISPGSPAPKVEDVPIGFFTQRVRDQSLSDTVHS